MHEHCSDMVFQINDSGPSTTRQVQNQGEQEALGQRNGKVLLTNLRLSPQQLSFFIPLVIVIAAS